MDATLIHIIIIWSKGLYEEEFIVSDLSSKFNVLNTYDVHWSDSFFHDNLKRFYAHSQSHRDERDFKKIIENKIIHCGADTFTAIIFEDESPKMEEMKTSNGVNLVNKNVFDLKMAYRERTGGGHKIHASDNFFEVNKDISLLFGLDARAYKEMHPPANKKLIWNENIVGVPFYKNVKDLFFVLNNCIEYVVLRNFECLPDEYNIEGHGDIDLLVSNLNYAKYVTGAVDVYPELSHRVYHHIKINGEYVPFDFRFLGDDYYDLKWELDILRNKKMHSNGFYCPNHEDYFYSLLYHAYVQKRVISEDYKLRLSHMANKIGVSFPADEDVPLVMLILNTFMRKRGYTYKIPQDTTVFHNKKNTDGYHESETIKAKGKLISSSISRNETQAFIAEVYENEHSFIKVASHPISHNENRFLNVLNRHGFFPKVLSFEKGSTYDTVEVERIKGIPFSAINSLVGLWNPQQVFQLLDEFIDILKLLADHNIVHRDIKPDNLFLIKRNDGYHLQLFDFGWAVDVTDSSHITPVGLGGKFKNKNGVLADAPATANTLKLIFHSFQFFNSIFKQLHALTFIAKKDRNAYLKALGKIQIEINIASVHLSHRDKLRFQYKKIVAILGEKHVERVKKIVRKLKKKMQY
ncbi:MAG: protein kinase domain-containing protein [Patiriisocius sp.]|uniref:protein kinase domain-containing protein n=1 Tax=Patiriisocius sp. TaxID=2822396 RepID=UPI003EF8B2F6